MKVTIKTIKNEISEYEVEETTTIAQLKEMIHNKEGHDVSTISLIYKSKMMKEDDKTIGELNIKDPIVMVVKKSAPVPKAAPKPAAQPAPKVEQKPEEKKPVEQQQNTPATQPTNVFGNLSQPKEENNEVSFEEKLQQLVDMGFGREESTKALRKAKNNISYAANLLSEGINLDEIPDGPEGTEMGNMEGNGEPQEAIQIPGLPPLTKQTFVQLCQSQPEIAEQFAEPMSQGSALLKADLLRNPEEMFNILLRGAKRQQGGHAYEDYEEAPRQYQRPPQQQQQRPAVQLSEEDNANIAMLESMGFPRDRVVQAYIVADKDVTAASNLLLDGTI